MQRARQIRRVFLITLFLNLIVSGGKIVYGYYIDSVSILSDGFHSLFDCISNVVGLIAITLSIHPPDSSHPYGHRKIETLFTAFIGLMMLLACYEIFKNAYESLIKGQRASIDFTSLIVMSLTLIVNVFVVWYEKRLGSRLNSEFLIADSKHTLSDVLVSLGVILGLLCYLAGFHLADAIAGLAVGLFVLYTGLTIVKEASEVLIDKNQTDTMLIKEIVCCHSGVIECHEIRARGAKGNVFLDLHVLVEPSMAVSDAHRIAHEVEDAIRQRMPEIVDIVVHIEPK